MLRRFAQAAPATASGTSPSSPASIPPTREERDAMGINKDTNQERNTGQAGRGPSITGKGMLDSADYNRHFADSFKDSSFFRPGSEWQDYEPAYQYGYQSFDRHRGRRFEEVEPELAQAWNTTRRGSKLGWAEAREAVREGWHYLERDRPGDADRDGR
jgi:hypothetical protein